PGVLRRHAVPSGPGVRVDAGVEEGGRVEMFYDPMISKLVTWGRTREEAIDRMDRALSEYDIAGVSTTIPFCRFVMQHEAFRTGRFSTQFVSRYFTSEARAAVPPTLEQVAAIAATLYSSTRAAPAKTAPASRDRSGWRRRRTL
ncbi:MAG: biotin carboxylase, partial [Bacteroidota bacterium]